jgi:S-DNA-T family DNA segregation ATPase FtsK/SpoIIIE
MFRAMKDELDDVLESTDSGQLTKRLNTYVDAKDLNARIAYQYPKSTSSKAENNGNIQGKIDFQKGESRKQRRSFHKQYERRQTERKSRSQQANIEERKEIVRHGSFRPSVTPSPIYGYDRPPQTGVIEYELTGFFKDLYSNEQAAELETQCAEKPCEETVSQPGDTSGAYADHVHGETVSGENHLKQSDHPWNAEEIKPADYSEKIELRQRVPDENDRKRSPIPFNVIMLKNDRQQYLKNNFLAKKQNGWHR